VQENSQTIRADNLYTNYISTQAHANNQRGRVGTVSVHTKPMEQDNDANYI